MTGRGIMPAAACLVVLAEAAAAAPPCADRAQVLEQLLRTENKAVVARAVTGDGDLYEIAANARGEMSVVRTFAAGVTIRADGGTYRFPPGTACVAGEGRGFQIVAARPGRPV